MIPVALIRSLHNGDGVDRRAVARAGAFPEMSRLCYYVRCVSTCGACVSRYYFSPQPLLGSSRGGSGLIG